MNAGPNLKLKVQDFGIKNCSISERLSLTTTFSRRYSLSNLHVVV